ncbi:hypothetical protein GCM10010193_68140 [Kitasatospora atroaurantiaca]
MSEARSPPATRTFTAAELREGGFPGGLPEGDSLNPPYPTSLIPTAYVPCDRRWGPTRSDLAIGKEARRSLVEPGHLPKLEGSYGQRAAQAGYGQKVRSLLRLGCSAMVALLTAARVGRLSRVVSGRRSWVWMLSLSLWGLGWVVTAVRSGRSG